MFNEADDEIASFLLSSEIIVSFRRATLKQCSHLSLKVDRPNLKKRAAGLREQCGFTIAVITHTTQSAIFAQSYFFT